MSHYCKILTADIANFTGFRVSIWLSGCRRYCKGCFNPQAWDFNYGREFDAEALKKVENELQKEWIEGSSILGRRAS